MQKRTFEGWKAVLAALAFAPVATAQMPASVSAGAAKIDEIECAYHKLAPDQTATLAASWLDGRHDASDAFKAGLRRAVAPCAVQYGWSTDKAEIALDVALYNAAVDRLARDLKSQGAAKADELWDHWRRLPAADRGFFLKAAGASESDAFAKRLRPALAKAGVPDTDEAMADAFALLEALSQRDAAIEDWLRLPAQAAGSSAPRN